MVILCFISCNILIKGHLFINFYQYSVLYEIFYRLCFLFFTSSKFIAITIIAYFAHTLHTFR